MIPQSYDFLLGVAQRWKEKRRLHLSRMDTRLAGLQYMLFGVIEKATYLCGIQCEHEYVVKNIRPVVDLFLMGENVL